MDCRQTSSLWPYGQQGPKLLTPFSARRLLSFCGEKVTKFINRDKFVNMKEITARLWKANMALKKKIKRTKNQNHYASRESNSDMILFIYIAIFCLYFKSSNWWLILSKSFIYLFYFSQKRDFHFYHHWPFCFAGWGCLDSSLLIGYGICWLAWRQHLSVWLCMIRASTQCLRSSSLLGQKFLFLCLIIHISVREYWRIFVFVSFLQAAIKNWCFCLNYSS